MTAFELISYIVLWILVAVLSLLMVGFLQQMGLLQQQIAALTSPENQEIEKDGSTPSVPPLEEDGPRIGTSIPELVFETINGYGTVSLTTFHRGSEILLLFLAPTCESCQHTVEFINGLIKDGTFQGKAIAFLRADDQGCRAFQNVFPLHFPVVCDPDRSISMGLDTHRTPLGLLYDPEGQLVRKAIVEKREDFLALFGDTSVVPHAQNRVFPLLPLSSLQVEIH